MATGARQPATYEPSSASALIGLVDDDISVRESLPDLLNELGFAAKAYASGSELLGSGDTGAIRCLLIDVAMPTMSGPELHRELRARGHQMPVVFMTANADDSLREDLMARGASECVFKPFDEQKLQSALDAALRRMGQ